MAKAKRLTKETLGTISIDCLSQSLTRCCYAKTVIRFPVLKYENAYKRAVVTPAFAIDLLEIISASQMLMHKRSNNLSNVPASDAYDLALVSA